MKEDTTTGCTTPDIEHGHVYPTCTVHEGGTVHFWCDHGYQTQGSEALVCGRDGNFQGEPVCVEVEVRCNAPRIENAAVIPEGPIGEGTVIEHIHLF